jgi:hypothetical protein
MRILIIMNLIVILIVFVISAFIGISLKKWSTWLLVIYVFLSGSLIGFLGSGGAWDFLIGFLFVIIILSTGIFTHWQREFFGKKAPHWLQRDDRNIHLSLLSKMIKRLQNKKNHKD